MIDGSISESVLYIRHASNQWKLWFMIHVILIEIVLFVSKQS